MKPKNKPKTKRKPPPAARKFNQSNEVRAIARERVGAVKPAQIIVDKKQRRKPKHKAPAGTIPESV